VNKNEKACLVSYSVLEPGLQ